MVRALVDAIARNDKHIASSLFATGVATITLLVLFCGSLLAAFCGVIVRMCDGGGHNSSFALFSAAGCIIGFHMITSIAVRARSAFQETYVSNVFGGIANAVSALLLWILMKPGATALSLIVALNLPLVIAQLVNGIVLVYQKSLLRGPLRIDWRHGWEMLRESSWLSIAQGGSFLERHAPKIILAVYASAAMVGAFSCAVQLLVMAAGLIVMVSAPLMPAIADSIQSGDNTWWPRRVFGLVVIISFMGLLGIIAGFLWGPYALHLLYGPRVNFGPWDCGGLACWITAFSVSHVFYTTLVAAGKLRSLAIWQMAQGGGIATTFLIIYPVIGLGGMFWVMAGVTVVSTAIPWGVESKRLMSYTGYASLINQRA